MAIKAVVSIYHYCLKFPTPRGVKIIWGKKYEVRMWYFVNISRWTKGKAEDHHSRALWRRGLNHFDPEDPILIRPPGYHSIAIYETGWRRTRNLCGWSDHTKKVKIRTSLSPWVCETMISYLWRNIDVFVLCYNNMKGISPELICYQLNIYPRITPRR